MFYDSSSTTYQVPGYSCCIIVLFIRAMVVLVAYHCVSWHHCPCFVVFSDPCLGFPECKVASPRCCGGCKCSRHDEKWIHFHGIIVTSVTSVTSDHCVCFSAAGARYCPPPLVCPPGSLRLPSHCHQDDIFIFSSTTVLFISNTPSRHRSEISYCPGMKITADNMRRDNRDMTV